METSGSGAPEYRAGGGKGESDVDEGVERRLAHFAFVREERDREVRLLFHDAQPVEIAATFKAVGAKLISISGERALPAANADNASQAPDDNAQAGQPRKSRKGAPRTARVGEQLGNLTIRYFFDLNEIVYTVSIVAPLGIVGSVASIYPSAHLAEAEIQQRLGVVFSP